MLPLVFYHAQNCRLTNEDDENERALNEVEYHAKNEGYLRNLAIEKPIGHKIEKLKDPIDADIDEKVFDDMIGVTAVDSAGWGSVHS